MQVEHSLVRPVDVLDREHQRLLPAGSLDQRAHGGEDPVAHALRVLGVDPSVAATSAGTSMPSGRAISAARRSGGSSVTSSETSDSNPR